MKNESYFIAVSEEEMKRLLTEKIQYKQTSLRVKDFGKNIEGITFFREDCEKMLRVLSKEIVSEHQTPFSWVTYLRLREKQKSHAQILTKLTDQQKEILRINKVYYAYHDRLVIVGKQTLADCVEIRKSDLLFALRVLQAHVSSCDKIIAAPYYEIIQIEPDVIVDPPAEAQHFLADLSFEERMVLMRANIPYTRREHRQSKDKVIIATRIHTKFLADVLSMLDYQIVGQEDTELLNTKFYVLSKPEPKQENTAIAIWTPPAKTVLYTEEKTSGVNEQTKALQELRKKQQRELEQEKQRKEKMSKIFADACTRRQLKAIKKLSTQVSTEDQEARKIQREMSHLHGELNRLNSIHQDQWKKKQIAEQRKTDLCVRTEIEACKFRKQFEQILQLEMIEDVSFSNGVLMIETNNYCTPIQNTTFRIELNIFDGTYRIFEHIGCGIDIGPLAVSNSDFTKRCKSRLGEHIAQDEIVDAVICVLMITMLTAISNYK